MKSGFYSKEELAEIGFKSVGEHVLISRKVSVYNPGSISIGNHVRIDDFCLLSGGKYIQIGNYIHIGAYSALFGGGGILMEDFSGMSPRCTLHSESDDFLGFSLTSPVIPMKYKPRLKSAPIILRKFSGPGSGSTLLPGVELKEGAVVGAHSLVTKSCDEWSVYSGSPAKRIMRRSQKMLDLEEQFLADVEAGTAWKDEE